MWSEVDKLLSFSPIPQERFRKLTMFLTRCVHVVNNIRSINERGSNCLYPKSKILKVLKLDEDEPRGTGKLRRIKFQGA